MINEIVKWQKERLLDKQRFNYKNESVNIAEELIEMSGFSVPKEYRQKLINEFSRFKLNFIKSNNLEMLDGDEAEIAVDALFDICVFAIGGMLKLGYEPECVFREGINEISTRGGSIVDGKFQKDTSEEAKRNWYKANFKKCLKNNK